MRKTLTVLTVLAAAGSLAACDYFKKKEDAPPAPVATATEPTTTAVATETPAPVEQAASVEPMKPATPEATPTTEPAKK
ncbi:MAG: hypothetical protein JNL41_22145 [Phenylobacterium sp.]|uniref:hypothetical protein n=1 Tax=Phenylobacterium sp. TaxID=1871053 RepID=UPI001A4469F1|nr:hypothetical protein [Phenylobacterium sp.]MBL8556990.1 hypothetical protein [Phenylobacterium sp.]